VPGCPARAPHVAHAITCPRQNEPSPEDRLDNLRSLCAVFDAQIKEHKSGRPVVKGCDIDGWPLTPDLRFKHTDSAAACDP